MRFGYRRVYMLDKGLEFRLEVLRGNGCWERLTFRKEQVKKNRSKKQKDISVTKRGFFFNRMFFCYLDFRIMQHELIYAGNARVKV